MVFILVLAFTPQSNVTGTLVSLVFVIKMRMMGMTMRMVMMTMVMMTMVMMMRMVMMMMRMVMRMRMMMMKIDINDVLDDITLHTLGSGGVNVLNSIT